jgi:hypothetical protein
VKSVQIVPTVPSDIRKYGSLAAQFSCFLFRATELKQSELNEESK